MTDVEAQIKRCRVIQHPWVDTSISNILRDKKSGWAHNYYRETERTMWDAAVVRAEDPYEIRIESMREELEKAVRLEAQLDARAKDTPQTPIKPKEKALELLREASMAVRAQRYTLAKTVEAYAKDENIHYLKMRQMQDRYRARFLQQHRNKLMLDGDENYLAKAVSWVYKYTRSWIDREASAAAEAEAEAEAEEAEAEEAEAEAEAEAESDYEEDDYLDHLEKLVTGYKPSRYKSKRSVPPAPSAEKVPGLVVFDLDFTIWPFDCHKDRHMPFVVTGQKIVDAWGRDASPYPDMPGIITELVERGIPVAYASRNPSVDQLEALLRAIAIAPKNRPDIKTLWDVLPSKDYIQAYSSGLSRAKTKHFTALQRITGVPFAKMLFFDDDRANITTAAAQGVIAISVMEGMTRSCFETAMKVFQGY